MIESLESIYEIIDCVNWIKQRNCYHIALQFEKDSLHDASSVVKILKEKTDSEREFYIIVSECCGVDYISSLHLGPSCIDSIIKFGNTCLAPLLPTFKDLDVLFVFKSYVDEENFKFAQNYIFNLSKVENHLLLYDTKYFSLVKKLINENHLHILEAGRLNFYSSFWFVTSNANDMIVKTSTYSCQNCVQFNTKSDLESYHHVVYFGEKINLNLRISCKKLTQVNLSKKCIQEINVGKELSKRISLIERLKKKRELHFGILFTNFIPSVEWYIEKINKIKNKHHRVYKIVLIQSTDECKLGNFSSLDAFVAVNSCDCSNLIDSIKEFHVPIINLKEYEIICNLKTKYGSIYWNSEETFDDIREKKEENEKEKNYDANNKKSKQIMLFDDPTKPLWYGLEINPGFSEIAMAKEGQRGIARFYSNEANSN